MGESSVLLEEWRQVIGVVRNSIIANQAGIEVESGYGRFGVGRALDGMIERASNDGQITLIHGQKAVLNEEGGGSTPQNKDLKVFVAVLPHGITAVAGEETD